MSDLVTDENLPDEFSAILNDWAQRESTPFPVRLLTPNECAKIKRLWKVTVEKITKTDRDFGFELYLRLFEDRSELTKHFEKDSFKYTRMKIHSEKMISTLNDLITNLENDSVRIRILNKLLRQHSRFGIKQEDHKVFEKNFIEIIERIDGNVDTCCLMTKKSNAKLWKLLLRMVWLALSANSD